MLVLGSQKDRLGLVENRDLLNMAKMGRASTPLDLMTYEPEDEQPSIFFLQESPRQAILTDSDPDEKMYAYYFRWLETADEYFEYWGYPEQGRWEIYGLALPDEILRKVYSENAERISVHYRGEAALASKML